MSALWIPSWRADPSVRPLADRHYTRQKPGAAQFVPPSRPIVLKTRELPEPAAYWVSSWAKAEYVKHAWAGAWICSAFRNERRDLYLSSELIREAVAITVAAWGSRLTAADPFWRHGFVSFVDADKTKRKRDPGRCFVKAGWTRLEETTKAGLVVLQLLPSEMGLVEMRGAA